jgi:hypothetical protein
MPSKIQPTIGRKVWFYNASYAANCFDQKQALDATVIYVHPDGPVNLSVVDHAGHRLTAHAVSLEDPTEFDGHGVRDYATWMPFQMQAAAKGGAQ